MACHFLYLVDLNSFGSSCLVYFEKKSSSKARATKGIHSSIKQVGLTPFCLCMRLGSTMNFIVHPDDIKMSELSITTKCFNEAILVVSHDLEPVEVCKIELFSWIRLT